MIKVVLFVKHCIYVFKNVFIIFIIILIKIFFLTHCGTLVRVHYYYYYLNSWTLFASQISEYVLFERKKHLIVINEQFTLGPLEGTYIYTISILLFTFDSLIINPLAWSHGLFLLF